MKKESHRYNINRQRSRHGHKHRKYKKCLNMMMLMYVEYIYTLEAQFMRKLNNTEAELKKSVAYKKKCV